MRSTEGGGGLVLCWVAEIFGRGSSWLAKWDKEFQHLCGVTPAELPGEGGRSRCRVVEMGGHFVLSHNGLGTR